MTEKKRHRKPYTRMTAEELAEATKEFDSEIPASRLKPLSARGKRLWNEAQRGRGRPRKLDSEKVQRVLVSVDQPLLRRADAFAKRKHLSRSELIAQGIELRLKAG